MLNLRGDIAIEQLQDKRHDNTEDSRDERHFHTFCHDGGADVALHLYILERHDHADDRSEESQRRRHGNEQLNPRAALL